MSDENFHVSLGNHLMSGAVHHARAIWRVLGNLESSLIRKQIEQTPIVKPIYVAGLARAGTSILIEILASHPDVSTHQYRDFPFLFIPYWWRQTLNRSAPEFSAAQERAHGDRLMVTPQSPEAMEEVLWMAYFKHLHDPHRDNALDHETSNARFEEFYRDHIRKLLLISDRTRYAAKGNYNLTRLEYLLRLFPDARFVVLVRDPRDHIASLMKQHRIFIDAAEKYPRSVAHLDRVGHFEFGAHRRCIKPDVNRDEIESIESMWRGGEEVRGWAKYWAMLYRWLGARLDASDSLRRATLVLRYEDLCDQPRQSLARIFEHTDLRDEHGELSNRWSRELCRPTYYRSDFTQQQLRAIEEETGEVASKFGYLQLASR